MNHRTTQPKILIAEDELIVAENIARHLRQQGYEVVAIVDSGEAAIVEATQMRPDLILMDIRLKGEIDGVQATAAINAQLQLPIIYMTAYADDETLKRAKLTDPYGYLVKPFKSPNLKTTIEVALQKHRSDAAKQAKYRVQLQEVETKLSRLINLDPLTALPNRFSLKEWFQQIVARQTAEDEAECCCGSRRKKPSLLPVFCLSLDQLQRVKHLLGYESGDRILQAVATRLTAHVGPGGMIARTDINEFAAILQPTENRYTAMQAAQGLLEAIARPLFIDGQEFFVTASLGAALYPRDGENIETLLQFSRKLIDHLQRQGGNRYEFYTHFFKTCIADDLALEADLHYALERQELQLVYQPRVQLHPNRIISAEALLRWHHPIRGLVSPVHFIPIAEATGLIESIGEWVLQTACRQLQTWHESGLNRMRIAVNLSGSQLKQPNLHQQINKILLNTNLDPASIELELTESTLIEDIELASYQLQALKEMGLQIAMDDFGTGYSSLSHLHRLPFDTLKLDRSFVQDINCNPKNGAIAIAIISMAHQLNLRVVAEGVETQEELTFLQENRCDEIQGYFFSYPLPVSQFELLVRSSQRFQIE